MYTDLMRVTGLSGIDTESMIKKLMNAESLRLNTLQRSRQKLIWQQESYRNVSSSLKSFQNSILSVSAKNSLMLPSSFKGFVTTVKSGGDVSSAISVSAGTGAKAGNYSVKVEQIAKADLYRSVDAVGGTLSIDNVNFDDLKAGDSIKISLDGTSTKEFTFSSQDLQNIGNDMEKLAEWLNSKLASYGTDPITDEHGVKTYVQKATATYDSASGGIVISTTPGHRISIGDGAKSNTNAVGSAIDYTDKSGLFEAEFTITSGGNTETINFELDLEKYRDSEGVIDAKKANAALQSAINTAIKDSGMNSYVSATVSSDGKVTFNNLSANNPVSITSSGTGNSLESLGFTGDIALRSKSSVSALGISSGSSTALDLNKSMSKIFGESAFDADGKASITINGVTINDIDKDMSLNEVMRKINGSSAGVNISYNTSTNKFEMVGTKTGQSNAISFDGSLFSDIFGIDGSRGPEVAAQDAIFSINGELSTSRESNNFTINGLTIDLTSAAEGKTFDINVSANSEGVLNTVKEFIKQYNSLIDAMNAEYRTSRPKSDNYTYYEPLTDAERENMTEKQIEEWEKQAKTGLNYNDSIISSIAGQMRSLLYEGVKLEDGSTISLYQIGITTSSDLSQSGKLVLDEEKFNKVFAERGDDIATLFTKSSDISASDKSQRNARFKDEGIADRLNDIINNAILTGGSLYEKAGIENNTVSLKDNNMYKQIKAQEDKISEMRKYLATRENYYYQMFSKLESAVTQSNNQMSSLLAMLGQ